MFTVTIKQHDIHFPCVSGQSILAAAIVAKVQFPVSCRNGSCRTCMCKLERGKVRYDIEWPSLSKEEKVDGWILACVAIPETDVLICLEVASKE